MTNTQYINDCVNNGKEFEFIKEVSDYFYLDYYKLCDFTFDLYNYNLREGIGKRESKILSLRCCFDYATNGSLNEL